jgi:hypothetical protein
VRRHAALRVLGLVLAPFWIAVTAGPAHATNSTPYYLFDGDSQIAWEIVNGAVANTFSTFSIGYPVAARDTIWLGDLSDTGAVEYQLDGTATGSTSAGGISFYQLLDGAAGPNANYAVECCGTPNSVTVAGLDWSNQQALFDLDPGNPPTDRGDGIAYDLSDDTLYVATLSSRTITHYDLVGNVLDSFVLPQGQGLVALAYEQSTDTLWVSTDPTGTSCSSTRAGASCRTSWSRAAAT